MSEATLDALAADIRSRLDALATKEDLESVRVTDEKLREMIQGYLADLPEDDEFVRKLRFGPTAERKLVGTRYARWGLSVADVEFLYDLQVALQGARKPGGGHYPGPSEELRHTFEAISEARYIPMEKIRAMDQKALDDLFPRVPLSEFHGADQELAARGAFELTSAYQRSIRAMDTAESGFGSQLVGAQYVGELWEAARRDSRIFALLNSFEMTDPTAYLPVEADIPELLFVSESTGSSAANYATSKTGSQRVQVDAKKFVIHQMWSGEMEEDSIIPYIPFLRRQALISLGHYSDSVVVNGDATNAATGNINLDDADPADTKHYLAFDGIRHAGLVDQTGNSKDVAGPISLGELSASRDRMIDSAKLIDWGSPADPADLIYAADPETARRIAMLDEVLTVDKYGPQASVLTGEQAKVLGHPLIGSIAISKTEADGKVSTTAANNTKGQVVVFNRRGCVVGWRRRVKVETERIPATDQTRIVYSLRLSFGRYSPTGAASGLEFADVLYDISL